MSNKKNDDPDRPAGIHTQFSRDRLLMPPEIEENLKRVYQASLTEAVPDRFAKLLAKLREKEEKP